MTYFVGEFETCQFRARTGPSAGPLSMFRSYMCNLQNNCGHLDDFQDVPTYPGSKYDSVAMYGGPILYNQTVQDFSQNMPDTLKIVNSTAKALNNSIIMTKYVKKETVVGDMFYDTDTVQAALVAGSFDEKEAKVFIEAILRIGMISGDLAALELQTSEFVFDCSNSTLSLFLPQADRTLLNSLELELCSSGQTKRAGFIKALQANLDYSKFIDHFKKLGNRSNSSKVINSVASGISLMNDLRSVMDQGFVRKRQIEVITEMFPSLLEELALFTEEIGQYYDEDKARCLLESSPMSKNALETFEKCNTTEIYDPLFNLLKEQFPIWKNFLLVSSNSEAVNAFKHCDVDVNRYAYLSGNNALTASDDFIQCPVTRKREALDLDLALTLLDPAVIEDNLERWRTDSFTSMNWTDEALDRLGNVYDHLSDVVTVMQSLPIDVLDPAIFADPNVIEIMLSSRASLIVNSLKEAVNQTDYFMKNSVLWNNYTRVVGLLGKWSIYVVYIHIYVFSKSTISIIPFYNFLFNCGN